MLSNIRCISYEDYKKVLYVLETRGYRWISGKKPTEHNYYLQSNFIHVDHTNKELSYGEHGSEYGGMVSNFTSDYWLKNNIVGMSVQNNLDHYGRMLLDESQRGFFTSNIPPRWPLDPPTWRTNLDPFEVALPEPKVKIMNVLEFAHTIDPNFIGKWKMYEHVMKGKPEDLIGKLVTSVSGGFGTSYGGVHMRIKDIHNSNVTLSEPDSDMARWSTGYDSLYESVVETKYYNNIRR